MCMCMCACACGLGLAMIGKKGARGWVGKVFDAYPAAFVRACARSFSFLLGLCLRASARFKGFFFLKTAKGSPKINPSYTV